MSNRTGTTIYECTICLLGAFAGMTSADEVETSALSEAVVSPVAETDSRLLHKHRKDILVTGCFASSYLALLSLDRTSNSTGSRRQDQDESFAVEATDTMESTGFD